MIPPEHPQSSCGAESVSQAGSKALREFDQLPVAPIRPSNANLYEPREDALASLRSATAGRHRILEGVLPLATQPLEVALYSRALAGFEIFLQAWEPRLRSALPIRLHAWLTTRSRYELVRADIESLRLRCERTRITASTEAVCIAAVNGIQLEGACARYAAFGSMYVLEGSALGGQVIAKAARDSLDIHAHNGGAYFNGFGPATATRWRSFLALLDTEVGSEPVPCAAASRAAEQTFDALIRIFTMLRHAPAPG